MDTEKPYFLTPAPDFECTIYALSGGDSEAAAAQVRVDESWDAGEQGTIAISDTFSGITSDKFMVQISGDGYMVMFDTDQFSPAIVEDDGSNTGIVISNPGVSIYPEYKYGNDMFNQDRLFIKPTASWNIKIGINVSPA